MQFEEQPTPDKLTKLLNLMFANWQVYMADIHRLWQDNNFKIFERKVNDSACEFLRRVKKYSVSLQNEMLKRDNAKKAIEGKVEEDTATD